MAGYLKRLGTQRILLFAAAVLLLIYVRYYEYQIERFAGCYDCGWETRQAFYLLLGVVGLLVRRWWSLVISLLLVLKVLYAIGRITFWNNIAEKHGALAILKSSLAWSSETHLEFFVLLAMAVIVLCYAALSFRRSLSH